MSNKLELVIRSSDPAEFAELLQGVSALVTKGNVSISTPNIVISNNLSEEELKGRIDRAAKAAKAAPAKDKPATPEPAPAEAPAEPSPVPEQYNAPSASMVAVREALVPLIQSGKQKQVQELFQRFGGTKLSDVPEDRLGELLAAAEELKA